MPRGKAAGGSGVDGAAVIDVYRLGLTRPLARFRRRCHVFLVGGSFTRLSLYSPDTIVRHYPSSVCAGADRLGPVSGQRDIRAGRHGQARCALLTPGILRTVLLSK